MEERYAPGEGLHDAEMQPLSQEQQELDPPGFVGDSLHDVPGAIPSRGRAASVLTKGAVPITQSYDHEATVLASDFLREKFNEKHRAEPLEWEFACVCRSNAG